MRLSRVLRAPGLDLSADRLTAISEKATADHTHSGSSKLPPQAILRLINGASFPLLLADAPAAVASLLSQGFRTVLSTHGVTAGAWYFEATVLSLGPSGATTRLCHCARRLIQSPVASWFGSGQCFARPVEL